MTKRERKKGRPVKGGLCVKYNTCLEQETQRQRSGGRVGNFVTVNLGGLGADSAGEFNIKVRHIKPDTRRIERRNGTFRQVLVVTKA